MICANPEQWPAVERVALEQLGENLGSALLTLLDRLQRFLAARNIVLTNENLEGTPGLHTLIDGIDSTLIDLASEEVTEERLVQLAADVADQTFAVQGASILTPRGAAHRFSVACNTCLEYSSGRATQLDPGNGRQDANGPAITDIPSSLSSGDG